MAGRTAEQRTERRQRVEGLDHDLGAGETVIPRIRPYARHTTPEIAETAAETIFFLE